MLTRALCSPKPVVGVSSLRLLSHHHHRHHHHHCGSCPVCSCTRGFSTGQAYKPPMALVQELRKRTGASISKCRDALVDEVGDVDKAMLWLKKRGIQSASEKTYRQAGEGVVAAAVVRGHSGALVEMSCETDFVGRTPLLIEFARTVAGLVAESSNPIYWDLEGLITEGMLQRQVECDVPASEERPRQHQELQSLKISDALLEMSSVLGENIGIKRIATIGQEGEHYNNESGHLFSYVHSLASSSQSREVGKMASLIMLDKVAGADVDAESLGFLGKVLAMQVVAKRPKYVRVADIPSDVLESERQIARAAHVASIGGKELPDKVMDKIVDGKMSKLRADDTLYEMEILLPNSTEENSKVETVGERLRKSGLIVRSFRFMGVGMI